MIPVQAQPESIHFSKQVRIPGQQFLSKIPKPTSQQWRGREYWQRVLPDMRKAYDSICAYSAFWIPHSTGNHSIDHFIPKSKQPSLAYEWHNYRYVSARFNSRKGTHTIVDPFKLLQGWFRLDFKSFLIKPNSEVSANQKEKLWETIKHLKLNDDEDLVIERQTWYLNYLNKEISFGHLKKKAPFIALEAERQDLIQ
jgi:5-methylcytosine-specific restriction endonuclease McrA